MEIEFRIKYVSSLIVCIILTGCATVPKPDNPFGSSAGISEQEKKIQKPVVSEFIIGPGDELEITVWRQADLTKTVKVSSEGIIFYPIIGEIQAGGFSIYALRNRVRDGLFKYYVDPQVGIRVVSTRSQKVFVLGEVMKPGVYQIENSMDVIEAISLAGGFTRDAKKENLLLLRGDLKEQNIRVLNIKRFLANRDVSQNISLQRGDVLFVPPSTISNVARIFRYFSDIISPVLELERGMILAPEVGSALSGENSGNVIISP